MQHVLVCSRDSVLAKKVRFLLARDERSVEILKGHKDLTQRLARADVDLLLLSRDLDGEDAVEFLGRMSPGISIPPTLVLGGERAVVADFIHLIPDPIDTQEIYRLSSNLLDGTDETADDEELTTLAMIPPRSQTQPDATAEMQAQSPEPADDAPPDDEELSFLDVTGLDEIAGKLDELESASLQDNLSDAFHIEEEEPAAEPDALIVEEDKTMQEQPSSEAPPPVLGGMLEPARFAKVMFQCWSKEVTGALVIARDTETLTVYFDNGGPVHLESSVPGDQLGRALVSRGRITEAQYADGAKRAIERGIDLGPALVDLGFFSQEELGEELGTTARDRIVQCFEARSGAFDFDPRRPPPSKDRPYRLIPPHIIAQGIRQFADNTVFQEIIGDIDLRYFKLRRSIPDLCETYPISELEQRFLEFEGRAYNVNDAAEASGLDKHDAKKLLSLLTTCEEVDDFTPGVKEFEDRIKETQKYIQDLQSTLPQPAPATGGSTPPVGRSSPPPPPIPAPHQQVVSGTSSVPGGGPTEQRPTWTLDANGEARPANSKASPPPPAASTPTLPPPVPLSGSTSANPPPPVNGEEIPPMPTPPAGSDGMTPRPLVYAKPLPRGPDGSAIETSERTLSREHFQRGVTLLGQGNFANAEEAFRDAVALCSEEHVYLIGLARAIYYNPGYGADGKVPVLRSIVDRASNLAPGDKRVETLSGWVAHAEHAN